ncbi:hypothetical protein H072_4002 [Dactylellina haptotyla CBS 200.50]|uniref:Mitochondrial intermediate peptidase n=1 Tax=Dactylellina haptotyla (strain CBS 200.50) TaxID=1284197 RepID=S8ALN1_DACHA|nr:hypothetical protein H072_4002 [Dactylellina haptotyla CBS 200.50]
MQPALRSRAVSRILSRQRVSSSALLRPPSAQNYVCNDCRRRRFRTFTSTRYLPQEATALPSTGSKSENSTLPTPPVKFDTNDSQHDDSLLRAIFDSPVAYEAFSSAKKPRTGLFQNRFLTNPNGFIYFANTSLERAQEVVKRVCTATTQDQLVRVIKDLDLLSDLLCRVLDLADFVRNTHPDPGFVQAADMAFTNVYEYMNVLNTTSELYDTLKRAMNDPAVVAHFGEVERAVGRTLLADFEKSGIKLPKKSKDKFVSLSSDIVRLGRDFVNAATTNSPNLVTSANALVGMEPWMIQKLSQMSGTKKVYLPVRGPMGQQAMQMATDKNTRYKVYEAQQTSSRQQINLLEDMLHARGQLAQLVGRESHAAVTVADKMARTPEAVTTFLQSMLAHTRPLALAELQPLKELKAKHEGRASVDLYPWDKDFYFHRLLRSKYRPSKVDISEYFSLGTVMQGLSRLFTRLYGVRLVPQATAPGEIWNNDVRRLDVIDEEEGHIAVVYCDLFQRPEKNPNPAHFTVRCSRALEEEEIAEYRLLEGGGDGMATARNTAGELYQLPTIALICDFSTPKGSTTPLLAFHEVTTLFHEMGHAIHSILGRTKYHEVAGTRCPTDFAEFPSILMEHFAKSPEVLALFARHYITDEPLPVPVLQQRLSMSQNLEHTETYHQVILSLLDQELHSAEVFKPGFSSTEIYRNLESKHSVMDQWIGMSTSSWQGNFSHLFGYGGLYYSYMLDKCIADKVWGEVFSADPVNREAGERYKEEVLKWGGSRDPWRCIGNLLGREDLVEEEGGRMEEVGKWVLDK